MKNLENSGLKGFCYDKNGKISTPKMKVDVDKNNRVKLELINMSKAEQDEIIDTTVKAIYGDNFSIEAILGGVRIYAPAKAWWYI